MKREQSGLKIMSRLIVLVKPLAGYMCLAVLLGVLGFLCAIRIKNLSHLLLLHMYWFFLSFKSVASSSFSPAIAQKPPIGSSLTEYNVGSFLFFLLNEKILGPIPIANS